MSQGVKVWDPLVRIGHWTIVAAFAIAYLTEDDLLSLHVWAGYILGAAVLIRVFWGFVGPKRARFSDFAYGPRAVFAYLSDLVRFRASRYLGHSPAGGAMVIGLLIMLAGTVATGVATLGADKHAGPLASFYASDAAAPATSNGREESVLRELHELLANLTLALVGLHIAGVLLASVVHRENLVAAMITGNKHVEPDRPTARSKPALGS